MRVHRSDPGIPGDQRVNPTGELLERDHTEDTIARRLTVARRHSYLGDFVLGSRPHTRF